MTPNLEVAREFLTRLGYDNWTITAIIPDGKTLTRCFNRVDDAVSFASAHNPDKNIYYTLNIAIPGATSKPPKRDITEIRWVHADLDPDESEQPKAAKARYLAKLAAFKYKPTFIIDSGNGIQALWRIEPVGPNTSVSEEDRYKHVEIISQAIMLELGSKAGTQNADRILRIPGFINWPNKVKRDRGLVPIMSDCLSYNELCSYTLDDFAELLPKVGVEAPDDGININALDHDPLWWTIMTGGNYKTVGERSEGVWWCINELLRRGYGLNKIKLIMLNKANRITAHIYDQKSPANYLNAQIESARTKLKFVLNEKDPNKRPLSVAYNLIVALIKLGIEVRLDEFTDTARITGLDGYDTYNDAAVLALRALCHDVYKFNPAKEMTFETLDLIAQRNTYHPVEDYFASLKWDGVKRLDHWLTIYGGATDNAYTNTVGALMLVAAVRRVKYPGTKFDEMVVLESPVQGTNKSSTLEVLAGTEWFADNLPFNLDSKQVIEILRGRLIVEAAELSGMRRAEVEHMKAFLSRTVDRVRMAYDRKVTNIPRQCIIVGTTNDSKYLKDTGGNRRFWPVRVQRFDLVTLKRDRDQLWAEAILREGEGASIQMEPGLWEAAAEEQLERVINDPFTDTLRHHLSGFAQGKITRNDVVTIIGGSPANWTQDQNGRLGKAMETLGWRRPGSNGQFLYEGRSVTGWLVGEGAPRNLPLITAYRDRDSGQVMISVTGGLADEHKDPGI